jgi:hypothetical protein
MDPAFYRAHIVSRGLRYHYFLANAEAGQPTLLLLHGFPSSSYDWHRQVVFFRTQGYGVLVPDLLGYGGTAQPEDIQAYALSQQAQDIVDILQAEHLERVISVSHDWYACILHTTFVGPLMIFRKGALPWLRALPTTSLNVSLPSHFSLSATSRPAPTSRLKPRSSSRNQSLGTNYTVTRFSYHARAQMYFLRRTYVEPPYLNLM